MATIPPVTQATQATPERELPLPQVELIETDGEPLESEWHRAEINLLVELVYGHIKDRTDFYAGGNMFVYYSVAQARNWDYRGPDFFFVKNAEPARPRPYWAVWEEGGRYPDVIVELLSPTTAREDRTTKKDLYENVFKTADYFCYDLDTQQLEGWRLSGQKYQPLSPNPEGRLWCATLGLWLGTWTGVFQGKEMTWLRFWTLAGVLVPTGAESGRAAAEAAERERDEQRQRAEAAEAELARLKAELDALRRGQQP